MQDEPETPEPPEGPSILPAITVSDIDTAPIDAPPPAIMPFDGDVDGKLYRRFQEVSDENFDLRAKLERIQSGQRTAAALDKLIEPYASKAYRFMVGYSVSSGGIILADGANYSGFHLPDQVLELLVGSTAVTVIGLVGMVLTGIFVGARKVG